MNPFAALGSATLRTFRARPLASTLLVALGGSALAGFYAIALPAERFGAFSLGALAYLSPGEAIAAAIVGYGGMLGIAINLASNAARSAGGALTSGGLVAALLPSSLCCTTLVPSALAALGVSAPAVLHVTGRFQGFLAAYSDAFVAFAVIAVLAALLLAVRTANNTCKITPQKESR